MNSYSGAASTALANALPLPESRRVLDVAGGSGSLSARFLVANPNLRGTVLDRQGMQHEVQRLATVLGIHDRIDFCAQNMFEGDFPNGYDVIALSNVFHDWKPESCAELARKSYDALEPGGLLVVQEVLLDEDKNGPLLACLFDTLMRLCEPGMDGRQYTFNELRGLIEAAGFSDVERLDPLAPYSGIVARR